MLAYALSENIDGNKLIKDIQQMILQFQEQNPNVSLVLTIDIKKISYDDSSIIPKLETRN